MGALNFPRSTTNFLQCIGAGCAAVEEKERGRRFAVGLGLDQPLVASQLQTWVRGVWTWFQAFRRLSSISSISAQWEKRPGPKKTIKKKQNKNEKKTEAGPLRSRKLQTICDCIEIWTLPLIFIALRVCVSVRVWNLRETLPNPLTDFYLRLFCIRQSASAICHCHLPFTIDASVNRVKVNNGAHPNG